jgi:hypothetical protein
VSHNGPLSEGEKAVNAIRASAHIFFDQCSFGNGSTGAVLPKPIIDWAQPMPYTVIQTLFDPLLPKGLQWDWKGDFVSELPDAAVDAYVAQAAKLRAYCPECTSIRWTAPCTGRRRTRRPGATATPPGRW